MQNLQNFIICITAATSDDDIKTIIKFMFINLEFTLTGSPENAQNC